MVKTFLKVLGILILLAILCIYLVFLFVLPNIIDLNKYKEQIQTIVKEQANLELNIENLKLITTPSLNAGITTGHVSVKLPDNSTIFNTDNLITKISLPNLLLLKVKVSGIAETPVLTLDIADGKQLNVLKYVENLLNKNEEQAAQIQQQTRTETGFTFDPSLIKIVVSAFRLDNYKVCVNDLKTGHYLTLKGDAMTLGYNNGKTFRINTDANLLSDGDKNIVAKLDIDTFLPEATQMDEDDDKPVNIELPLINPVATYRNYNIKADVNSKLKIREKNGKIKSWGYFNLKDFSAKLSNLQLPKSYVYIKTSGYNVDVDSSIYFAKNQNLTVLGKMNYNNPNLDLDIHSKKIYINDMIILTRAVLDTVGIRNDFKNLKGEGYILADTKVKTNFKKLKSQGFLLVNDGKISSKTLGLVLDKMHINLNFDNNTLDIINSGALINGKKLNINGNIDKESYADIAIFIEQLPLPELYRAFAPLDVKKQLNLLSGYATAKAKITGKLKHAVANCYLDIADLKITDSLKTYIISNQKTNIEFFDNFSTGLIKNKNLNVYLPISKSSLTVPLAMVNIDSKTGINIPQSFLKVNDNSLLAFSGSVKAEKKKTNINFVSTGSLYAKDLKKFAGKDCAKFIFDKGKLPFELSLTGTDKKQTLIVNLLADDNNYVTPLNIASLSGKTSLLQAKVDFKGNRIKIKDSGLFIREVTTDEEGKENVSLTPVIKATGTIVKDVINRITISVPKEEILTGFKNSTFDLHPARVIIYGKTSAPKIRGNVTISNVTLPVIYTSLKNLEVAFKGMFATFDLAGLSLNKSDLNIFGQVSLIPAKNIELSNMNITSRNFDVDKVMKVSVAAMKLSAGSGSTTSNNADIPVLIKSGDVNFRHIKSGNIILKNTTAKFSMLKNIVFVKNLRTNMNDGTIVGRISTNLVTGFLKVKVSGIGLNTEKLLLDAANMKDTLTGSADFITDITLSGSTYEEQVKSLKGTVKFKVSDGQFGPFGKLENLIMAENIRESEFFKTTIGSVINSLVTIDTTHFKTLEGVLKFKDGIVEIEPITSCGNVLTLHLFGNMNLLTNRIDMKMRSKLASQVSDMLGPISAINPVNLVKNTPGLNVVSAKAFSIFCEQVTSQEMDQIPDFAQNRSDSNATKFQVVIRGDVNKPLTLIKSFKWLATQGEMEGAQEFVSTLPDPEAENVEEKTNIEVDENSNIFKKIFTKKRG